jgi:hypothetical protein
MYVLRNIKARSCNHCCSGKAMNITYSECVFVGLGVQHAVRMSHIVIFGLPGCTIFFHIVSYTADIRENFIEHKMCVLIFCTTLV